MHFGLKQVNVCQGNRTVGSVLLVLRSLICIEAISTALAFWNQSGQFELYPYMHTVHLLSNRRDYLLTLAHNNTDLGPLSSGLGGSIPAFVPMFCQKIAWGQTVCFTETCRQEKKKPAGKRKANSRENSCLTGTQCWGLSSRTLLWRAAR